MTWPESGIWSVMRWPGTRPVSRSRCTRTWVTPCARTDARNHTTKKRAPRSNEASECGRVGSGRRAQDNRATCWAATRVRRDPARVSRERKSERGNRRSSNDGGRTEAPTKRTDSAADQRTDGRSGGRPGRDCGSARCAAAGVGPRRAGARGAPSSPAASSGRAPTKGWMDDHRRSILC